MLVREATAIGDDVSIGSGTVIEHHVALGDGVRLHSRCFVPEYSVLEDGAWLGPGVIVTNARYPNRPDTKENLEGVHIGRGRRRSAPGVCCCPASTSARARSSAPAPSWSHDVAPGATVVGNPARCC